MTLSLFHRPLLLAILGLSALVCGHAAPQSANSMQNTPQPTKNLLPAVKEGLWKPWSPRSLTKYHAEIIPLPAREAGGTPDQALTLRLDATEGYARWITRVSDITPGATYEFRIEQKADGVPSPDQQLPLVLSWFASPDAKRPVQRNYIEQPQGSPGWQSLSQTIKAPSEATSVAVELGLCRKEGASVLWKNPQLREVPPTPPRKVRIVTTHIVPPKNATVASNTKLMLDMMNRVGKEKPDIVVFSENLADRYVSAPIDDTAQPIPGPLTRALSEKARLYNTYIVTSLNEKDSEGHLHVTAVLIDRKGEIAGTYRKVHLPLDELEKGLIPGNDHPVFDTDFGRVGMLICWDNWFPEAARIMRLQGAEILLLPIAGDGFPGHWNITSRARAIDNSIHLVSSITVTPDVPSQIINPMGEVIGEAGGDFGHVLKEIDLNEHWRASYRPIGIGKGEFYIKERRPDTYHPLLGR